MIMDAQQEFFTALKLALEAQGYDVYDNQLPPENTPYPFIYLANTNVTGYGAKAQYAGYITQLVQVWGTADMRGTISSISLAVHETVRKLRHTDHYAFNLIPSDSEQRILNDNTTKTPLMQSYNSLRVFFSRR